MLFVLNRSNSVCNRYLAEMRDIDVQQDRMRFRRNQERIGEVLAYEISKELLYTEAEVQTPLGTAQVNLPAEHPVLCTILRAGLPLHQGFMNVFDRSPSGFVTAYRKVNKNGTFIIKIEHISAPDLQGRTLILCDTMLATGQSVVQVCKEIMGQYELADLHIAAVIASSEGVEHVRANLPMAKLWIGAIDEEMTTRSYIVPGLGDAGDLSFGEKI
ncbi:uracil phosphoribosyltransferase [Mucilaginibacter daejeonensis]|uniref:uracil phosphoribosyltransferase n=1 Tax=Mucilaginibacter daejeonensis TaxID=398049 RepID=UPI001D17A537|nr:uracil phosphoribosyltransferase [Mucilaginibacter daejeonensis]UEG52961.1 uracil phosphoribosyltransferase [Mucilaginibacter daejeonensis]